MTVMKKFKVNYTVFKLVGMCENIKLNFIYEVYDKDTLDDLEDYVIEYLCEYYCSDNFCIDKIKEID